MGLADDELRSTNARFFFTKSEDWRYEREVRMLAMPREADKTIPGEHPVYLFNFPREAVRKVILGHQMPAKLKEEFVGLIEEQYPRAALWQAQLDQLLETLCGQSSQMERRFLARL